jgi:hypothetical protein
MGELGEYEKREPVGDETIYYRLDLLRKGLEMVHNIYNAMLKLDAIFGQCVL